MLQGSVYYWWSLHQLAWMLLLCTGGHSYMTCEQQVPYTKRSGCKTGDTGLMGVEQLGMLLC
jgi:hypothetical protein